MHGQHEHQGLLVPESHLDLLDAYAGLESRREHVAGAFQRLGALRAELETLRLDERQKLARVDLLTFQRDEITQAAPRAGEDEDLVAERSRAGERREAPAAQRRGVPDALRAGRRGAERARGGLEASRRSRRARSARGGCTRRAGSPSRRSWRTSRTSCATTPRGSTPRPDGCRRWRIVWRCSSVSSGSTGLTLADVLAHREACVRELALLASADERAADVEVALQAAERDFLDLARRLSAERREAATTFAKDLVQVVAGLAMERTRFDVRFNAEPLPVSEWGPRGIDRAEFFVSPNPGEDLRPLARIVSGGELSRLMLAIKTLDGAEGPGRDADLRRGGRRHRRSHRRRGRTPAAGPGPRIPGALHHASPADRGARRRAVPDQQASPRRQDRHARGAPRHAPPARRSWRA